MKILIEELIAREKILKLEVEINNKKLTIINDEGIYIYNKKLKMYVSKTRKVVTDITNTFSSEEIWYNYLRIDHIIQLNISDPKKEFASKCLFEFMSAINNYDLHKSCYNLVECATNICILYSLSDYEGVNKSYKQFIKLLEKYELDGTADLCDPIREIITKIKRSY